MQLVNNKFQLSAEDPNNCFTYNRLTYKIISKLKSNIFLIHDPVDEVNKVMKICKVTCQFRRNKMVKRFDREIIALNLAKDHRLEKVIKILFDGTIHISGFDYRYYVMERAGSNLRDFLGSNKIDVDQRYLICRDILDSLKSLHSIGVYHRDIKPENILFVENYLKIADLGLIANRVEDNPIDEVGDRIGPFGWVSPEAMNKFFTENVTIDFKYDCDIDEKSDVFQLGKLFWFIFQGNVPIGQVLKTDFMRRIDSMFDIIYGMTQHMKDRRLLLAEVESRLIPLAPEFNC